MATAKRDLTNPTVQGQRPHKDPLDRLVAIAIRVAVREGLLDAPVDELPVKDRSERDSGGRRSA